MPNPVARKRHLRKVLDRWENEGGAMPEKPAGSTQTAPSDPQADKGDQPPAKSDAKRKASKKRR